MAHPTAGSVRSLAETLAVSRTLPFLSPQLPFISLCLHLSFSLFEQTSFPLPSISHNTAHDEPRLHVHNYITVTVLKLFNSFGVAAIIVQT